jgi:anthranilate phosphoribosyltransferase
MAMEDTSSLIIPPFVFLPTEVHSKEFASYSSLKYNLNYRTLFHVCANLFVPSFPSQK